MTASPFVTGYLKAMLDSEAARMVAEGPGGPAPTVDDISDAALEAVLRDCEAFWRDAQTSGTRQQRLSRAMMAGQELNAAGRDFWLSRNGEPAFLGGGWGEHTSVFAELARRFPKLSPYLSDDGKVHGLGEVPS